MVMYQAMFRMLPGGRSVTQAHQDVLKVLDQCIGLSRTVLPDVSVIRGQAIARCDLDEFLPAGVTGSTLYVLSRASHSPHDPRYDDTLELRVDPSVIDYSRFLRDMEHVIDLLATYWVECAPLELLDRDFEESLSRRSDWSRRVYPVSFYADWYCEETYGMTKMLLQATLEPLLEYSVVKETGLFLVGSTSSLSVTESDKLTETLTAAVRAGSSP